MPIENHACDYRSHASQSITIRKQNSLLIFVWSGWHISSMIKVRIWACSEGGGQRISPFPPNLGQTYTRPRKVSVICFLYLCGQVQHSWKACTNKNPWNYVTTESKEPRSLEAHNRSGQEKSVPNRFGKYGNRFSYKQKRSHKPSKIVK